ncbi:MAG TPA: nitrilase-related carbon-nitrogen hydrolase [Solirubrobacteraceae bacterium]|nr:nitrilase-related carbon-nitrogen hydrolase [Solirubrobacteraceae bacterium]
MRRALAAVAALAALPAMAPAAGAREVRAFAVSPKFTLDWVDTRADYRGKLFALVDRRRRGRGAPAVQPGADDVASHLLGPDRPSRPAATARDLVTLPEDLGLMAFFGGSRGEAARRAPSLVGAVAGLLGTYAPLTEYYARRFPDVAARPLGVRLLALAATDTQVRYGVETFAAIADSYDVYLAVGASMATDWHVVCTSRTGFRPPPGARRCDEEDPAKVARLRDPDERGRDYAYEATGPDAANMTLLFDPDGRLIAKQRKAYLTPTDLPGGLDLRPGPVDGPRAIRTPVGTLGMAVSKDAFMPDVLQKLDQRGVDVLVQPEFFVNDVVGGTGQWAPDTLKASGYSAVQRHPGLETLVLPSLTGNVFDFSADAQGHVAVKPRRPGRCSPSGLAESRRPASSGCPGRCSPSGLAESRRPDDAGRRTTPASSGCPGRSGSWLVGQPPAPGLGPVQSWVVGDPQSSRFAARRERLRRVGRRLLPGEEGPLCATPVQAAPCQGGQVEGVVRRTIEVDRHPPRRPLARGARPAAPFGRNVALAPGPGRQRNVTLAARGARAWAAFEERRGGADRLVVAASGDGGRRWARRPAPAREAGGDQWWPALAAGPEGRLWLAWQQRGRVRWSTSRDAGRTWSPPRAVDGAAAQWEPALAAGERGRATLAFVDERDVSADDALPQAHLRVAALTPDRADPSVRLDLGTPVELAAKLDHAWAPSVAADGARVLVSYLHFRTYDWRVYARASADGGRTFGDERLVSPGPPSLGTQEQAAAGQGADLEQLDDTPRSAWVGGREAVAYVDFRKRASSAREPHQLYDVVLAGPGGARGRVDSHGPAQLSSFSPAIAPLGGDRSVVAWQDHGTGIADVRAAAARGARAGGALHVRDSGARGNGWRPQVVRAGGDVLVAWEDERAGRAQVLAARAPAARLR